MRGQFISIEGLEGAGKTTQAAQLCQWLDNKGVRYIRTREPGGTDIAEQIRHLVLDHHTEQMDATTELLLVFAARKQHVETLIRPALEQGTWVVSDRFTDATYAYQGGGRQLDWDVIERLEQLVLGDFAPDLTLWFDCAADIGLSRARQRGSLDRIEQEAISFFDRCRAGYQQRADADPARFAQINANQEIEQVSEALVRVLEAKYDHFG